MIFFRIITFPLVIYMKFLDWFVENFMKAIDQQFEPKSYGYNPEPSGIENPEPPKSPTGVVKND